MFRNVTVYCSSGKNVARIYFDAAREMGEAIAREGWGLVYGGNRIGPMGAMADAARKAGGRVIGVTPRLFVDQGLADTMCDELIVCENMRDRKSVLEDRGDAFVALPGGLGTLEELFDILVARQLGYHHKPIALANLAGYYAPLLAMLESGISQGQIKAKARELYFVAGTVSETMEYLRKSQGIGNPQ